MKTRLLSIMIMALLAIITFSCTKNTGPQQADNRKWEKVEELPETASGIYALDDSNVWVSGAYGGIYHYDGNDWGKQYKADVSLQEIVVADKSHVWALGYNSIFFFDGSAWSKQFSIESMHSDHQEGPHFTSISASDQNHVWASSNVGLYSFDGSSWLRDEDFPEEAICVAALDENHVWASTDNNTYLNDGSSWGIQSNISLYRISARDIDNVWGKSNYTDELFHLENSQWITTTDVLLYNPEISAAGQGTVFLAGSKGPLEKPTTVIYSYNSDGLFMDYETGMEMLEGVSAINPFSAWAVSDSGNVYRTKGY